MLHSVDIPWPEKEEELETSAQELIDVLLTSDPCRRPGAKGKRKLK